MLMQNEEQVGASVAQRLTSLLEQREEEVLGAELSDGKRGDGYIKAGPHAFLVEIKRASTLAAVKNAISQVMENVADLEVGTIPLVVVPFMGQAGRELCKEAGVSWLDLSGNAHIVARGLRIVIDGCPNQFKQRGRPSTAFAPKSARIARWLLMHPDQFTTQRQIARATDMDEGFTSRIISRLREQNLVVRDNQGAVGVSDPLLLLQAWREVHDFSKNEIVRGHVAARSSETLLGELANSLASHGIKHAATGLGAAWLMTQFAGFRTVTFYVQPSLSNELLEKIGFRMGGPGGQRLVGSAKGCRGFSRAAQGRGHPVCAPSPGLPGPQGSPGAGHGGRR